MTRRRWILVGALLVAGCSGPQSALDPAGDQASSLFSLWNLMLAVCGFMYALVLGFLGWAIWRARKPLMRGGAPDVAVDDRSLERTLAGWAGLIVLGLTVLISASFLVDRAHGDRRRAQRAEGEAHRPPVVVAYRVPRPARPIAGSRPPTSCTSRSAGRSRSSCSANDVIHSFWVPNLSGKIDLIPGPHQPPAADPRRRAGDYRGQCAEFCGIQHAHMALDVKVETAAAFEAGAPRSCSRRRAPTDPIAAARPAGVRRRPPAPSATRSTAPARPAAVGAGPHPRRQPRRPSPPARCRTRAGTLAGWIADPQGAQAGQRRCRRCRCAGADLHALVAYLDSLT